MGFIDTIKARAKADKKTIVLPESEDRRTYEAAAQILKEDLANLIIIGSEEAVKERQRGTGCLQSYYCRSREKRENTGLCR